MIYVECKADFALVQTVATVPKREIIHELNKSEICKRLSQTRSCIGMVDEDPQSVQPTYLQSLKRLDDLPGGGMRVLSDESRHNRVIILCPKLEDWLIRTARQSEIDLHTFGLPAEAHKFHQVINYKLDPLKRLLIALIDSKSHAILTLKKLLTTE